MTDTADSPDTPDPIAGMGASWQFAGELSAKAALIAGTTGLRTSMRWMEIATAHVSSLMELASASATDGDEGERARAMFREELVTVAREISEATSQETRRGVDDFDLISRDDATTEDATRPWKYKE